MKKIYKIIIGLFIFSIFSQNAFALSNLKGSDPSGKSQRQIIERTPWYDPTACINSSFSTQTISTGGKVFLIGDSITANTQFVQNKIIEALKSKGFSTDFDSVSSRRLSTGGGDLDGISIFEKDLNRWKDAGTIIIELGTNGGINKANIEKVMALIKTNNPNAKVYWINVGVDNNKRSGADIDSASINKILTDNQNIGYQVIDWQSLVSKNPNYIFSGGGDNLGVHPFNTEGGKAYADMIAAALGAPQNTTTTNTSTTTASTDASGSWAGFSPDPVAVDKYNKSLKSQIEKLAPYYKKAAENVGFKSWEVLPAIHNLEFGLQESNPTTNTSYAGVFQMNREILASKGGNPNDPVYTPGRKLSGEDITRQAEDALKYFIIPSIKSDKAQDLPLNEVEMIGIRYKSGSVYPGADPSTHAYTWAGFDTGPHKLPMPWGPGWGRLPRGGVVRDQQEGKTVDKPGFLTVYGITKGGNFSGSAGNVGQGSCAGTGEVVQGDDFASKVVAAAEAEYATRKETEGINGYPDYFVENAWCATFVSYIYEKAGRKFPEPGYISYVPTMRAYFENEGVWIKKGDNVKPIAGDVVVFDEGKGDYKSHVNIIVLVEGDTITTIGGNESNKVRKQKFSLFNESITGFGRLK